MSSKKAAVTLTAYEDLFSSEAERQEVNREQVQNVPLELFHPFPNHPFKVLDDEKMQDTVQSISEFGVLVPVLARPRPEASSSSFSRLNKRNNNGNIPANAILDE